MGQHRRTLDDHHRLLLRGNMTPAEAQQILDDQTKLSTSEFLWKYSLCFVQEQELLIKEAEAKL